VINRVSALNKVNVIKQYICLAKHQTSCQLPSDIRRLASAVPVTVRTVAVTWITCFKRLAPSGKLRCDNLESRSFFNSTRLPKGTMHTVSWTCVSCAVRQVIRSVSLDIQRRTLMCGSWTLRPLGRAGKRVCPTPVLPEIRTVHVIVQVRPVTTSRNSRDDPSFSDQGLWEHLDWN
jgi:hypothetical protein